MIVAAKAQEFRFGFNLFPVNTFQLKYDKPNFIMPDQTSVRVDETMHISARKIYLTGFYFRWNWHHLMVKTEVNYFNRYFYIGESPTPVEYSSDPSEATVRYLTFEVPLYFGYTLKPHGKFKITPFAGVSSEIGKLKPLFPPVMKTFEDMANERIYGELGKNSDLMPPVLINYTAGVELLYYGVLLQIAAKRNATPVFKSLPGNATVTSLMMIEATVGFGLHKGGLAHMITKPW